MHDWWLEPMRSVFEGRRVILAGAVAAAWTEHIDLIRAAGATDMMVYATEGRGAGPQPDLPTVVVEPPDGCSMMDSIRFGNAALAHPTAEVRRTLDDFDPQRGALVVCTFLSTAPTLDGRQTLAYRRPEWEALEDKTVVDAFWDRAGVDRAPSAVVPLADADRAADGLDRGAGTVWAADAREGFHGGGAQTYWVTDASSADYARAGLSTVCDLVRVMPFVDGVSCSIHGIVLPDGVVVLRPVELVVLRSFSTGFGRLVYAGCATYWDPPTTVRDQMRAVARRVGRQLVDEVGFRGTFTVDGVASTDGFVPTELNPRYGAGIMTIARAAGLPILLLNDLIVGGHEIGRSAVDVERDLVEAADAWRGGGTWMPHLDADLSARNGAIARADDGSWTWASDRQQPDATVIASGAFARCTYDPGRTPIGPSTSPSAARFWAFSDRELGTELGELSPAPDCSR